MTDEEREPRSERGGIALTIWILGIVLATFSVTSLIQHWSDVQFHGLVAKIFEKYRAVLHAAKEALFDWWIIRIWPAFKLPEWVMDVISLWLLMAFGRVRIDRAHQAFEQKHSVKLTGMWKWSNSPLSVLQCVAFGPIVFIGAVVGLFRATIRVRRDVGWPFRVPFQKNVRPSLRDILHRLFWVTIGAAFAPLLGTAIFFAWNAIQI